MRLVTSCPACKTLFHVQQEQLSPHQPEVRCGQCRHIFSIAPRLYALLQPQSLLPEHEPHPAYTETPTAPISYDSAPANVTDYKLEEHSSSSALPAAEDEPLAHTALQVEAPVEEVPVEEVSVEEVSVEEVPVEEIPVEEIPVEEIPVEETAPSSAFADSTPLADHNHESHASDQALTAEAAAMPRQRTETLEVLLQAPKPQAETEAIASSFLADRGGLHSPLLPRWLGIILVILLSLGALAQSSYIFRTELASHWPASKPWLVSACSWLGCTVPLARHAELLALDDSDLQENLEHPEVIQLSTTLINNASYTQAYPLLELTLTDDDDQPQLRRIFTPKEYLRAESDIEAGLPANEEIQIKLSLSTSDVAVSGYRVFVTY